MRIARDSVFGNLPKTLVADLLDAYSGVLENFEQHRWEPSELNGGKVCEAAYSIVRGYLERAYPDRAHGPRNMVDACRRLEMEFDRSYPLSARVQIPRMVIALYEIRNNRGVGHAGGDVNPNQMDATAVLYMSKWIVAELIRLLHSVSVEEARDVVEDLVERQISFVWQRGDVKRVLAPGLTQKQQVLLLLAGTSSAQEAEMMRWMEHARRADLRKNVLRPLHKARWIEFDETNLSLRLLPPGVEAAEELIRKLHT